MNVDELNAQFVQDEVWVHMNDKCCDADCACSALNQDLALHVGYVGVIDNDWVLPDRIGFVLKRTVARCIHPCDSSTDDYKSDKCSPSLTRRIMGSAYEDRYRPYPITPHTAPAHKAYNFSAFVSLCPYNELIVPRQSMQVLASFAIHPHSCADLVLDRHNLTAPFRHNNLTCSRQMYTAKCDASKPDYVTIAVSAAVGALVACFTVVLPLLWLRRQRRRNLLLPKRLQEEDEEDKTRSVEMATANQE